MLKSLYIHFPYCLHLCNYCDFYKKALTDDNQIDSYLELMDQQTRELVRIMEDQKTSFEPLETLYIGGGTPSLFKPIKLEGLLGKLQKLGINQASNCEFTIEIDPGTFNLLELEAWQKLGVNRFSVGVQAFEEDFLKLLDRRHGKVEVKESLTILKDQNLNFSVDLMIGIPQSEKRDLKSEIDQLLAYSPSHFSVYILQARANYPLKNQLPNDELIRRDFIFVSNYLKQNGFNHYEVSNFAKGESKESLHNKRYWDYQSVAAVGPNATGTICYSDRVFRYQWKSLSEGFQVENVTGESLILEKLFIALRRSKPVNLIHILGSELSVKKLNSKLANWKELGYVDASSNLENVAVQPLGFLMNDSMINDLMDLF